jgi:hypothetical protein
MMLNVQQSLDSQKAACLQREEVFRKREEALRTKDLELQESLVLFDKFLKENEYKRQRAEHKAAEEAAKRLKWEKEIEIKQRQLADLQQRLAEKQALYRRYKPYARYFLRVMEVYSYDHSSDGAEALLHRYATLRNIQDVLTSQHTAGNADADAQRAQLQSTVRARQHESLLLGNLIARDSQRLDKLSNSAVDALDNVSTNQDHIVDLRRKLSRITMSIDNLYQRCCKVVLIPGETSCYIQHNLRKLPSIDAADVDDDNEGPIVDVAALEAYLGTQLDVIQKYLKDFRGILNSLGRPSGRS